MSRPQVFPSLLPARPGGRPTPASARRLARASAVAAAAALVGAATLAPPASAAALRSLTSIAEPFAAQAGPDPLADPGTLGATAVGNGRVAWVSVDGVALGQAPQAGTTPVARVGTLRAGAPVEVAAVPVTGNGLHDVELGTSADGDAILAVSSRAATAVPRNVLRLVNLDAGTVRTISSTRRGLVVDGVAIDSGCLYYVVHPERTGPRSTSSLWRATLTGTSIGKATKIRTSRRGEAWFGVHADRGGIAVSTTRPYDDGESGAFARDELAFGTPRGRWTRTGVAFATDGGYRPVFVLGFSRDGRSVVTAQAQDAGGPIVTRTPAGGGRPERVRLGSSKRLLQSPSYDPAVNRILAFGPDAAGTASVGWTASVFR